MSIPNVLDEKILNKQDNYLYGVLKYKDNEPKIVGTSSLKSQQYPADIDMLCPIENKPKNFNEVQRQFKIIFNKILKVPNLFFIEFKLQNNDKSKHKFFKLNDVNSDFFRKNYKPENIDLCKIDLLQFKSGYFQEVSCIYFFNPLEVDKQKYINDLLDDQKELYNEGKYYKSLKRFMVASKLQEPPNTNVIIGITNFFNSQTGKLYQLNNHIMACMIYMDKFGVDGRVKMFIKNIGLDGLDPNKLKDVSDSYTKKYNEEALKFYKHFNIPVGSLMPFQKKRLGGKVGSGFADAFLSGIATPFRIARNINPIFDFGVGTVADALGVPTIDKVIKGKGKKTSKKQLEGGGFLKNLAHSMANDFFTNMFSH